MKLINNRKFKFNKTKLNMNHTAATFYELKFKAIDNSSIVADLVIPTDTIKGVIIDFPEYKVLNKDYLSLSRYSLLGYAVISLHIRGQSGKSENNIPCSHFPFLDKNSKKSYYNFLYQDGLDITSIAETLFPNKPIFLTGVGQGAAISIVIAAFNEKINSLFIADCSLCDLENIYSNNDDVGFYSNIREFANEFTEKESKLLQSLNKIDVLNYSKYIESKVYYCHSLYDTPYPHYTQEKLLHSLKNIETLNFRLEYKKIFQHSFDDFILEVLSRF